VPDSLYSPASQSSQLVLKALEYVPDDAGEVCAGALGGRGLTGLFSSLRLAVRAGRGAKGGDVLPHGAVGADGGPVVVRERACLTR